MTQSRYVQIQEPISNNNMEDINEASINFRQYMHRQTRTNIRTEMMKLCTKFPNVFKISNDVLTMRNSSIKWSSFIVNGFNCESIREATKYLQTPEYDVFSRIISYNAPMYSTHQPMVDVFKSNALLEPRHELHDLELQIFNVHSVSSRSPKFIKTFDQFINNFNNLFFFYSWYHLIDYSNFHIAGGCLVTCLIDEAVLSPGQDVDLFYKGNDYFDYLKSVDETERKMRHYFFIKRVYNDNRTVVNLRLFINPTIGSLFQKTQFVDLQFIFIKSNYLPDQLLTNFDIDIAQLSFNGEILQGTMAAIQSIKTSTIINYALNNDDKDYGPIAIRISKYLKHGFRFLTPFNFNVKRFEISPMYISNQYNQSDLLQNIHSQYHSRLSLLDHDYMNMNYYQYGNLIWSKNYDCFHVQENFRLKIKI